MTIAVLRFKVYLCNELQDTLLIKSMIIKKTNEIISIGVPIYNSNGELLAAMTFITLASLFDMETLPEISGALIKQASKVSSALC